MKKLFLLLSASTVLFSNARAQQVRPANAGEIYHEISQLKNLANVLYFAAHPDDENTRLLAWLVNDQHIRTAYLSLTRGDGGQNIIGSEQGAALGYIRTHELLAARKLDGAEQFFTRAIDFGFSKTHEETFKHWDEDKLVRDAVWTIRKFRPDVIICRFPPNTQAGHGHHAASAIIAAKAFKAAGDKNQYRDQLAYFQPWQPKRILFNAFRFGDRNTTTEDQFKLPVGQYSPILGMGYGELAGISRSIHRSQGAGTPSTPGIQTEYFKLVDGDSLSKSLFDGIDITWNRAGREHIGKEIDKILAAYDFKNPAASLPALLKLRGLIASVNEGYWNRAKSEEVNKIILHCTGLMAELCTREPIATAGSTQQFTLRILARANTPVTVKNINWLGVDSAVNIRINNDSLVSIDKTLTIPENTPVTQPYWLSQPAAGTAHYSMPADSLTGLPETPNTLVVPVTVDVNGYPYIVNVPLSYKKLDPVRGDVVERLRIVPDVVLDFNTALIIRHGTSPVKASVHIHAYKDIPNASVAVYNDIINEKITGINLKKGQDTTVTVTISDNYYFTKNTDFNLFAKVWTDQKDYDKVLNVIQYDHIPTLQYFTTPFIKVLHADWKATANRIGYIEGAGDHVAEILRLAGLQVDILKDADMDPEKLKKYDAILTGIRAINTEKKMTMWMPALMQYTKNGGTLVMQYNTLQDMATKDFGPYPITLSSSRVTEEDAIVTFIDSNHKLLNRPNKITSKDFEGWVQERGLYFPTKWDSNYQPLFRMNDAGEAALDGSTLYAPYGNGHYVYTSLSFSRQLPNGNKGAIRLMMNLLSGTKEMVEGMPKTKTKASAKK
jgi:LmbE family N-acetylglucosaminyl deacetylase